MMLLLEVLIACVALLTEHNLHTTFATEGSALAGRGKAERDVASAAAAALCVSEGADVLRMHDVAGARDAVAVAAAVRRARRRV